MEGVGREVVFDFLDVLQEGSIDVFQPIIVLVAIVIDEVEAAAGDCESDARGGNSRERWLSIARRMAARASRLIVCREGWVARAWEGPGDRLCRK
jgi:hypothetical protein